MRLVRLKDKLLDNYHQRRADKHGWLYVVVRDVYPGTESHLIEARSVATGVVCTFVPIFVEDAPDAA